MCELMGLPPLAATGFSLYAGNMFRRSVAWERNKLMMRDCLLHTFYF